MPPFSSLVVEILLSIALIVAGGIFYFLWRHAAWLAGSRVVTVIVLAGLTLVWSSGVPGYGALIVMWIAAMVLAVIHLVRAADGYRHRSATSASEFSELDPGLLSAMPFDGNDEDTGRGGDRRVYI